MDCSTLWHYLKKYLVFAILGALFMVGEVAMDLAQPSLMSQVVDDGVLGANMQVILSVGLMMLGLAFLGAVCGSANNVFVNIATQNIGNELRKDCYSRALELSFSQIDGIGTGSLITRITNDVRHIEQLVSTFVRGAVRTLFTMFGSVFFLCALNPQLGLYLLLSMPVAILVMFAFFAKATPLFTRLQEQTDQLNAIMQEDLAGIRTVKACVREIYEKVRFGKANDQLIKTQLKALVLFAFLNPLMNCLMYLVIALLLLMGNYEVAEGVTTPGVIMASITYATQMLNAILRVVMLSQDLSRGLVSWGRLKEILQSKPQMVQEASADYYKGSAEAGGSCAYGVEFRDATFTYPDASAPVLTGVSFAVEPGQTVAIMGATGCGKSTLINLIPRFYDVTDGSVLVDGVDVREWDLESLRTAISFAQQRAYLFGKSVRENVVMGDDDPSEERLARALAVAQASDFVADLPERAQSVVAQRGNSLSGGQQQRIGLARAVYRCRGVLVLDDATSALDLKTEADFFAALDQEFSGITKIIVAQRVATARRADKIVVLENGKVSAQGTHEQLVEGCAAYRDICESQLGSGFATGEVRHG